jgi:hypothetical protein
MVSTAPGPLAVISGASAPGSATIVAGPVRAGVYAEVVDAPPQRRVRILRLADVVERRVTQARGRKGHGGVGADGHAVDVERTGVARERDGDVGPDARRDGGVAVDALLAAPARVGDGEAGAIAAARLRREEHVCVHPRGDGEVLGAARDAGGQARMTAGKVHGVSIPSGGETVRTEQRGTLVVAGAVGQRAAGGFVGAIPGELLGQGNCQKGMRDRTLGVGSRNDELLWGSVG